MSELRICFLVSKMFKMEFPHVEYILEYRVKLLLLIIFLITKITYTQKKKKERQTDRPTEENLILRFRGPQTFSIQQKLDFKILYFLLQCSSIENYFYQQCIYFSNPSQIITLLLIQYLKSSINLDCYFKIFVIHRLQPTFEQKKKKLHTSL